MKTREGGIRVIYHLLLHEHQVKSSEPSSKLQLKLIPVSVA